MVGREAAEWTAKEGGGGWENVEDWGGKKM